MAALPAEARPLGQGLFQKRGRVDENLQLAAEAGLHPARQGLQARLDHIVIVVSLGGDADRPLGGLLKDRQGIVRGPIVHPQHYR